MALQIATTPNRTYDGTDAITDVLPFRYDQTMAIGITGPQWNVAWQSAVVGCIIASVVVGIWLMRSAVETSGRSY
jgi:hypothetical protein